MLELERFTSMENRSFSPFLNFYMLEFITQEEALQELF